MENDHWHTGDSKTQTNAPWRFVLTPLRSLYFLIHLKFKFLSSFSNRTITHIYLSVSPCHGYIISEC